LSFYNIKFISDDPEFIMFYFYIFVIFAIGDGDLILYTGYSYLKTFY